MLKEELSLVSWPVPFEVGDGFAVVERKFKGGDSITWSFKMQDLTVNTAVNPDNTDSEQRHFHGVLLLGKENGSDSKEWNLDYTKYQFLSIVIKGRVQ